MAEPDFASRVALVTGSSKGIGRAISEALASRGAAVVAHGIECDDVAAVAAEWREKGWRVASSHADLASPDGAARLLDDVGTPDILVLNASIELPEQLAELTPPSVASQIDINFVSALRLLQRCLPSMQTREWGRVVAIGSVQEERPNARHLVYAATKTALTSVVLNLARHERTAGVTLNVVRPGAILTDRNRERLADPAFLDAVLDNIPLGRLGMPSDCGGIVAMLCSDAASYINGAVIPVDGGLRL